MCYLALFLYEEQEGLLCQTNIGEQLQTTDQTFMDEFSGETDLLLHSYLNRVQAQALALGSVPWHHQHLWGMWPAAGAAQRDSR